MSKCSASWAIVRSPLMAASATFALKAGEWFRRGRLFMVSPVRGDHRRFQAEIPLIVLSRFPEPALGGEIPEDYVFDYIGDEGAPENVRMSELFRGGDTLMLYHYMFPRHASDTRPGPTGGSTAELPLEQGPCPSCTALIDMWEGTRCLISTVLEEISQSSPRPQ